MQRTPTDIIQGLFKAQAIACDLSSEDSSIGSIVAGIVSAVFLSALTVVRLAGKRAVRSWGPDDVFISISFVLALITIGISIYSMFDLPRQESGSTY